jgi:hypothetical protein
VGVGEARVEADLPQGFADETRAHRLARAEVGEAALTEDNNVWSGVAGAGDETKDRSEEGATG